MTSWLPEWLKEISVYFWLAGAGLLMFVFTQDSRFYLDLWLLTFLYGLWGFSADKLESKKVRKLIQLVLLVLYTVIVIGFVLSDSRATMQFPGSR